MAGHNKWSKIRHKKGANDLNRAKEFGKATRAIRAASRACNGDVTNLHLQSVISKAKAIQVPKDKILDAIHGSSSKEEDPLVMLRYDCRIPTESGKVALILMVLTNNKNRSYSNLRTAVHKVGGEILTTGANDWFFDHFGFAIIHKKKKNEMELNPSDRIDNFHVGSNHDHSKSTRIDSTSSSTTTSIVPFDGITEAEEENILAAALEAGASDVDFGIKTDEHAIVVCAPSDLHALVTGMRNAGYDVSEFESKFEKTDDSVVSLDAESTERFLKFLEKIEDDDDVSSLYHNASLFES